MLGNLVLFLLTWGLLRFEGRSLAAIGLDRPRRRLAEFTAGFIIYGTMQLVRCVAIAPFADFHWIRAPDYSLGAFFEVMWVLLKAVLYEELIFRGCLLLLAIRFLGMRRGIILSAVAFGVYHWFSYGILGQVVPMIWVFLLTSAAGILFGCGFARSGTILMPIGLHLGTNTVSAVVFSDGPWGAQWLVPNETPTDPGLLVSVVVNLLWPLAYTAFATWALKRFYEARSRGVPSAGGT